ncbi:MAG: hypothetical protein U0900_09180 [Myxococcota bacterium]
MSLLAELRRRRVFRVAGTYGVVAGSLMQAGAVILPAFEAPPGAMRWMILALVGGFPIAVLLSYFLDISPRGVRLARGGPRRGGGANGNASTSEVERGRDGDGGGGEEAGGARTSLFARSLEMILLGLALPILGVALALLFSSGHDAARVTARARTSGERASLAVLPFEDLSSDGTDGGFFALGMHEDLLAALARIPRLRLISRTSVLGYADSPKSVREIGDELGVEHVVEGSVRRTATHVRVTAQLIRTDTDEPIWAEQFDAELADVFAVQTRIARAIAQALERELVGADESAPPPVLPVVPAAYDAYQKARDLHRNLDPSDRTTFDRAQHLYEEARRLDAHFPPAWVELAILHAEARWFGLDRSPERIEQARRCLEEARRLPTPPDLLALAEGIFAYYVDEDFGKALLFFDDAARLAPGAPEPAFYRAMILRRQGELDRALEAERKALDLAPLNLAYRDELAWTLALAGELEAARGVLEEILMRDPGRPRAQLQKWQLDLELDGRPKEVLEALLATDRRTWFEPHYTMLETTAILAGEALRVLPLIDRPAPTPLARARVAHQKAVLERHAGRAERAATLAEEARLELERAGAVPGTPQARAERRELEALIAAEGGRLAEAVALQADNVTAFPIERDLVTGGPPLWLLAELEIRAGRLPEAARALERLRAKLALGSVPFGGFFLLAHWPDFEAARRDAAFAAQLARWRPAYAERWPAGGR